ncbi:MAG TPA: VacJ family lipoprotein, partial [Terriglobales bacterium]|nr:VacJ family lipoprotein [Terriglobales bacterium]
MARPDFIGRRHFLVLMLAAALAVSAIGRLPAFAQDSNELRTGNVFRSEPVMAAANAGSEGAAAMEMTGESAAGEDFESDPWEGFNEKMFWFNREVLDRFILKPAATAWNFVLPNQVQQGIHNVFDNLAVVRRVVNNLLQAKFRGAGTETARFTINSTIGLAGFFDVAKDGFGIEQRDEDTGQTFGVWG